MSDEYAGTDQWPATVQVPTDSDPPRIVSLAPGYLDLADRTVYLDNKRINQTNVAFDYIRASNHYEKEAANTTKGYRAWLAGYRATAYWDDINNYVVEKYNDFELIGNVTPTTTGFNNVHAITATANTDGGITMMFGADGINPLVLYSANSGSWSVADLTGPTGTPYHAVNIGNSVGVLGNGPGGRWAAISASNSATSWAVPSLGTGTPFAIAKHPGGMFAIFTKTTSGVQMVRVIPSTGIPWSTTQINTDPGSTPVFAATIGPNAVLITQDTGGGYSKVLITPSRFTVYNHQGMVPEINVATIGRYAIAKSGQNIVRIDEYADIVPVYRFINTVNNFYPLAAGHRFIGQCETTLESKYTVTYSEDVYVIT